MPLTDEQHTRFQTFLEGLEPELKNIYPGGRKFVEEQIERFAKYGQTTFVSVKQFAWLESLFKEHCPDSELTEAEPSVQDDEIDMDNDIPF